MAHLDTNFATIFVTVMLLLFYAVGVLLLLHGIKQIRRGLGARSWPTTDGTRHQRGRQRIVRMVQMIVWRKEEAKAA